MEPAAVNELVAGLLEQRGAALAAKGDRYRYRGLAFTRAAQSIRSLGQGVDEVYRHGWLVGLQKIDGIGNRLAHEVESLLKEHHLV